MIYLDIDNTLADFDNWIYMQNPKAKDDMHIFFKTMYQNYKNCFVESKPLFNFDLLNDLDDFKLLTTLPNIDSIESFVGSNQSIDDIMDTFKNNKIQWCNHYFPDKEVLITNTKSDKIKYCDINDILIDDSISTGKSWKNKGGIYFNSIQDYLKNKSNINLNTNKCNIKSFNLF